MTSLDAHIESAKLFMKDVEEKLHAEKAFEMQKIVAFACSEASCDLFAILLHKKNLIDPGFNVNHRFFMSDKKAKEIFDYQIPSKTSLLKLLVRQEEYRNKICYGKPKPQKDVIDCIKNLYSIKKLVEKESGKI